MGTWVVLLSLGVFALVNLIKSLIPFRALPPAKLIATLLLSQAGWAFVEDWREGLLLVSGTFGLSTILHVLHKFLQAAGDDRRAATLRGRRL